MEGKTMTKKEVESIITSKAAKHGFVFSENGVGWFADRTDLGYISIQITEVTNNEKTDWASHKILVDIKAHASVCHMGGNPTPEELLAASDEIARGAKLVTDLQKMELSYSVEF